MTIEYILYLDTDDSPQHLYGVACSCTGTESATTPTGSFEFSGDGLQGVVSAPDDMTRRFVSEDFFIAPKAQIILRLDKFELSKAQDSLIRLVAEIARTSNGDMLLLFNGEHVVLRRRAGELVLREGFGPWTSERLALLGTPYRIGPV